MISQNKNILSKNTIIFTIGEVLPKLLSFFLLPIFLNYFSPSDYGILGYTNAISAFLPTIITFSLSSYLIRTYFELSSDIEKKKLIGNIFLFTSIVNVLFLILIITILPNLLLTFKITIPWDPYLKLSFLIFFLDIFSIIPLLLYRLKRDAYTFVLLSTAKVVLQYILILFFVVYLKFGLKGFYYGTFLALIPFVFLWFYLLIKNSILNYNSKQILSGLKFSFPLIPSSLAYVLLNSFDRFILEKYISISDLGLYNLANTLAFSLSIFISSAYKALEPEFFSRYADTDEFKLFVSQVKNQYYFILYSLAILLSLFSRDIIFNYAPVKFAETSNYIPMLLVSVLMTGHSIIYASILTSEKQTKIISFSILIGVILNVSLNFILIPIIGVYGAPVAAAFSYFGINLIYVFNIKTKPINFKNDFIGFFLFTILITALSFIEITSLYNYHFIYIKIIFFSLFVFYIANIFQINIRKLFKINFLNYN